MSRLHELKTQIHQLDEIKQIMSSMKTLAYLEVRKVERLLDNSQQIVEELEKLAADFLYFHPTFLTKSKPDRQIWILLGSERGFCGDFNEKLLKQLNKHLNDTRSETPILIPIGQRICSLTIEDSRVSKYIPGPNVVEEITNVLKQVVNQISILLQQFGSLSVSAIYHNINNGEVEHRSLMPPFQEVTRKHSHPYPPLLNIDPESFFMELVNQYVLLTLHEIAYVSQMAENLDRIQHMQGAVQHLDEKTSEITRKYNSVRQEEIIEEIEIMLLNPSMPKKLY